MDGNYFDEMVRNASRRDSRRSAARALAGAVLGSLGLGGGQSAGAARCSRGRERCGGRCRTKCPDVMLRDRRTCACACPEGMHRCGQVCVGDDACCPGEQECGGGCIREGECCTHTHKACPDGSCLEKGTGQCCPGVEVSCAAADGGCCNAVRGETCSDDGCCNELLGQAVCGGKCVDLGTDQNCAGCGDRCGSCRTCRNGTCVGPNRTPPACETCSDGRVVAGVSCGGHCCNPGAECCGGGCCPLGKCTTNSSGSICCLRVIDNRPYCEVM